MEHGTLLFTVIFGFLGQSAKSHPSIPNWIPNSIMLALGVGWYAGNHGLPAHGFAPIVDWLETALLAAASMPGTASIMGMIPALKSRG